MSKPPAIFCLIRVAFFYCGEFVIPNKIKRDLVYFFIEFFSGVHHAGNKDKF